MEDVKIEFMEVDMEWTKVEDGLPEVITKGDYVNGVFAKKQVKESVGFREEVVNTEYFIAEKDKYSHWMYIPEIEVEEPPLTNKELGDIREVLGQYGFVYP